MHRRLTRKPYKRAAPHDTPEPTNQKKHDSCQLHETHKTIYAQNGGPVHERHLTTSKEERYYAR